MACANSSEVWNVISPILGMDHLQRVSAVVVRLQCGMPVTVEITQLASGEGCKVNENQTRRFEVVEMGHVDG